MKILYSKKYVNIATTKHYPIVGYWYSLMQLSNPFNSLYKEFYNNELSELDENRNTRYKWLKYQLEGGSSSISGQSLLSQMHKAKVLQDENGTKLSIKFPSTLVNSNYKVILIYAIDRLSYRDLNLSKEDANGNYRSNIDNVSAVILTSPDGKGDLIKSSTNILDLKFNPICSFDNTTIVGSSVDQVTHYMSSVIDRALYYDTLYDKEKFIESISGDEVARDLQGTSDAINLRGHMTIEGSGLIKL